MYLSLIKPLPIVQIFLVGVWRGGSGGRHLILQGEEEHIWLGAE